MDACGAHVADKVERMSLGSIDQSAPKMHFKTCTSIVYSGASDQARLRIVHGWRAPSQDRDVGLDERNCSSRQQRSPKTIDATMPGAGKPISNALILRNAVVMRPLKSK